jgi:methanethiol S-methyltransferase
MERKMARAMERAFVWGGGAIFVASLALTTWRYLGAFGAPPPTPRLGAAVIDTLLLGLFGVHHSVFARTWAKTLVRRLVPDRLVRSLYVWIASTLLIVVCLGWQPVGGTLYRVEGLAALPFAILQLAGLVLVVRAVGAIHALELAGIAQPGSKPDDLQIRGPFRLVRHPLYLGFVLAAAATSHMSGDRLVFAAVTTLYIAVAIPLEERDLVAAFGDSYERYRTTVRWRLLPGVY